MTDNSILYNFSDFTHKHFREILTIAKINSQFISYNNLDIKSNTNIILCRHDVDLSMHEALNLARIENELDVKSTFFLLFHSEFYNLLEKPITDLVKEIILLGHNIGLHFDPVFYNIKNSEELEIWLTFEKEILQKIFNIKISVFSFHNPTEDMLRYDDYSYSSMINCYAKDIKLAITYCSDSNGYWRFKRMFDLISIEKPAKLQMLTHPEWWTLKTMSPKEKVWLSIDGRAKFYKSEYIKLMKLFGRTIIDWD